MTAPVRALALTTTTPLMEIVVTPSGAETERVPVLTNWIGSGFVPLPRLLSDTIWLPMETSTPWSTIRRRPNGNSSRRSSSGKRRAVGGSRSRIGSARPMPGTGVEKLAPDPCRLPDTATSVPLGPAATLMPLASSAAVNASFGISIWSITNVGTLTAAFLTMICEPSGCLRTRSRPTISTFSIDVPDGSFATLSISEMISIGVAATGAWEASAGCCAEEPASTGARSEGSLPAAEFWASCSNPEDSVLPKSGRLSSPRLNISNSVDERSSSIAMMDSHAISSNHYGRFRGLQEFANHFAY